MHRSRPAQSARAVRGGAGIPGRASPRPSVDISEGIISAVRLSAALSNLAFQKGFMKKQQEKQKASPRGAREAERDGILRHYSCWEELSPSPQHLGHSSKSYHCWLGSSATLSWHH